MPGTLSVLAGTGGALLGGALWSAWRCRLPPGRPLAQAKQLLVGHRGCRLGKPVGEGPPPENTLEAFEYAIAKGAQGFELDARLTKDGVPVVFHDARIGRCLVDAEGSNPLVADLTLAQLQALAFKQAPGVKVPTLAEAVRLAKERQAKILIETKDIHSPQALAAAVVQLIQEHGLHDDALVISFDPRSLYHVRRLDPAVRTCFLWCPGLVTGYAANGTEVLPRTWRLVAPIMDAALVIGAHPALLPTFLGASALGPGVLCRHTYLRAAHRRQMATYLWVVNDAALRAEVEGLLDQGLFAYSTDYLWPQGGSPGGS